MSGGNTCHGVNEYSETPDQTEPSLFAIRIIRYCVEYIDVHV